MYKLQKLRQQDGFTLVELIVVLVIIAILAAIAIPSMMKYVRDSRYAQGQTGIHSIRTAVSATLLDAAKEDLLSKMGLVHTPGSIQSEHPVAVISRGVPSKDARFKRFSQYIYDGLKGRLEEETDLKNYDLYLRITEDYQQSEYLLVCYLDDNDRSQNIAFVGGETFKRWFGADDFVKNANPNTIDYIMNP